MDVKNFARRAYQAGTGEDLMATSSRYAGLRIAMDSKTMAMIVMMVSLMCGLGVAWATSGPDPVHAAPRALPTVEEVAEPPVPVIVYVSGEVAEPGLVELEEGQRVADAIADRGGLGPEADPSGLNLAKVVTDGEHIYVPAEGEAPPPEIEGEHGGKININTATATELESLHGVGPALADRIIAYREEIGGFSSLDQLLDVSGIGDATFEKFADAISL